MPPVTTPNYEPLIARAEAIAKEFDYGAEDVRKAVKEFLRLMDLGLQSDNEAMTMIPTYVTGVPNGTEKGVYLAVDLGGTNFRVCSVSLSGDSKYRLTQSKVRIPRDMMVSDSHTLFSFLARQIELFVKEHHSDHFLEDPQHHLQLGFTFSFPVNQSAVNKGLLLRWTKGFDIADAVGKDVCELLQRELDALGLPVRVAALVNDTVGTLMARSYESPSRTGTLLGAIFGTGTNGAYVEKLARITKVTRLGAAAGTYDASAGEMVVNTEWGSFDNALRVLPNSVYDHQLDLNSVNRGVQMLEKRISGMFLGELLRLAVLGLYQEGHLFAAAAAATAIPADAPLHTPWSVGTSLLSHIEADHSPDLADAKASLEEKLGVPAAHIATPEVRAIQVVAHAIGRRSARLSAVPIAAIVLATGKIGPSPPSPAAAAAATAAAAAVPMEDLASPGQGVSSDQPPAAGIPAPSPSAGAESREDLEVIDIGVDGSVVEFYPGFEKHLREALRDVEEVGVAGEERIRIGIARDGSGVGAALIALVAAKMAGVAPK